MLEKITPVLLTYNEAPNIGRVLERLSWAKDIVIVDSFSNDETLSLVKNFPQARIFQRKFDNHANQCNFALSRTEIHSEWVLSLDADYVLSSELICELQSLRPTAEIIGFRANFVYYVLGRPLRGSLYGPVTVLFRRQQASYSQDGHAHRVVIKGTVQNFRSPVFHDDRKPFRRWIDSQDRYAKQEAEKLAISQSHELNWADRLRKTIVLMPPLILFYCLFVKGLILDGLAGIYYALQRTIAEVFLSLHLIRRKFVRNVTFSDSRRD